MELSVIIPAYNEEGSIPELQQRLAKALKGLEYEIIFIDDGSRDRTFQILEQLHRKDARVRAIKFRKNFGQTAAYDAGFREAKGELIATMDADLQNDPQDLPRLIEKLKSGYDVVSGWRADRKDTLSKRLFSGISLFFRKRIIDDRIHDSGCSLKVYRRECLQDLSLHGEMHRYITELLALRGFRIGELKVNHFARRHGKSKYNMTRLPKGFLDLLVVAFWQKYSARPMHLFGGLGILSSLAGFAIGAYMVWDKIARGAALASRPLLLLAALLVVVGIQFLIFGLIADILVKLYYGGERRHYSIEKIL